MSHVDKLWKLGKLISCIGEVKCKCEYDEQDGQFKYVHEHEPRWYPIIIGLGVNLSGSINQAYGRLKFGTCVYMDAHGNLLQRV